MSYKDYIARGLAVVAIVIAITGVVFFHSKNVAQNVQAVSDKFGAIYDVFTGDYFNAYRGFQLNGVNVFGVDNTAGSFSALTLSGDTMYFGHQAMIASTTVCAFQSPAATTSVESATATIGGAGVVASTAYIAIAKTAFATTTNIAQLPIAANTQATVLATTTPVTGMNTLVVPPSNWIVVALQGATTYTPTGSCSVQLDSAI